MAAPKNPQVQVSVTFGTPVNGVVPIQIGPLTLYRDVHDLRDGFNDRTESDLWIYLKMQMALVLQQAGIDPGTATPLQIKTAIEAQKYWV